MEELTDKQNRLDQLLRSFGRTLVALSGGVDSALVSVRAHQLLGERSLAVTGVSPSYSAHQRSLVELLVSRFGLQHRFVETHEIDVDAYRANGTDRCYHCKTELYEQLGRLGDRLGYGVVLDGTNADDRSDYRPGRRAAERLGVRSPLDEAGFTKADIRWLAKRLEVPVWEEPASACLASRIPHQTPVTIQNLSQVERAEDFLRSLGFRDSRVRHHGETARIELPEHDIEQAAGSETRSRIVDAFTALGFRFISVDLRGYRRGSLNQDAASPPGTAPMNPDRQ